MLGDRHHPSSAGSTARHARTSSAPARVRPDAAAMWRWLLSDAIRSEAGAILSWSNPQHPGYPYPEAAGLFLSTMCMRPAAAGERLRAADEVADWLCRSITADGGASRDGVDYVFDSSVALAGLLRYRAAAGQVDVEEPIRRLRQFVGSQIAAGAAVQPVAASADGRWSTQFGAHLVKCFHSLHLYAETFGERVPDDVVEALINRSGHQPSPVYMHPFCYEQEGHFLVAHNGLPSLFEPVDGALDWLATLQQPNGAILAFANGIDGFGEARSDATAQAVRLWLLRDPSRYARPIGAALGFLADCQTAQGGIRYTPASNDVCSWATMFTLQAVEWFEHGPQADELL